MDSRRTWVGWEDVSWAEKVKARGEAGGGSLDDVIITRSGGGWITGGWVTFNGECSEWFIGLEGESRGEVEKGSGELVLFWRDELDEYWLCGYRGEGRGDPEPPVNRDTRLLDLVRSLGDWGITGSRFVLVLYLRAGERGGDRISGEYESWVGA